MSTSRSGSVARWPQSSARLTCLGARFALPGPHLLATGSQACHGYAWCTACSMCQVLEPHCKARHSNSPAVPAHTANRPSPGPVPGRRRLRSASMAARTPRCCCTSCARLSRWPPDPARPAAMARRKQRRWPPATAAMVRPAPAASRRTRVRRLSGEAGRACSVPGASARGLWPPVLDALKAGPLNVQSVMPARVSATQTSSVAQGWLPLLARQRCGDSSKRAPSAPSFTQDICSKCAGHRLRCAGLGAVRTFIFEQRNDFPEILAFVRDMDARYGLRLEELQGDFRAGLASLIGRSGIKAIVLGTRRRRPRPRPGRARALQHACLHL